MIPFAQDINFDGCVPLDQWMLNQMDDAEFMAQYELTNTPDGVSVGRPQLLSMHYTARVLKDRQRWWDYQATRHQQ